MTDDTKKRLKDFVWSVAVAITLSTIYIVANTIRTGEAFSSRNSFGHWTKLLSIRIPLWFVVIIALAIQGVPWAVKLLRRRKYPHLHVVWEPNLCFWGKGTYGTTAMMQVITAGYFSVEGGGQKEGLVLVKAFLRGTHPVMSLLEPVIVGHGAASRHNRLDFFVAPVVAKEGEQFRGTVVFVDQFNREHDAGKILLLPTMPRA